MVGAVLPKEIIHRARESLARFDPPEPGSGPAA
jgi:hypothetical protein